MSVHKSHNIPRLLKPCILCDQLPPKNVTWRVCGRCRSVSYCSDNCQRDHWRIHKEFCKSATRSATSGPKSGKLSKLVEKISNRAPQTGLTPTEEKLLAQAIRLNGKETSNHELRQMFDQTASLLQSNNTEQKVQDNMASLVSNCERLVEPLRLELNSGMVPDEYLEKARETLNFVETLLNDLQTRGRENFTLNSLIINEGIINMIEQQLHLRQQDKSKQLK